MSMLLIKGVEFLIPNIPHVFMRGWLSDVFLVTVVVVLLGNDTIGSKNGPVGRV
jgi:hypothetical protein